MEKVGNVLIQVMEDLSQLSTNGSAHVRINNGLCEPERFKALFNHFARGTILERVDLRAETLQDYIDCSCGYTERFDQEHNGYANCPKCGRFAEVRDDSYQLVEPDPENTPERTSIRF